jgi:hypothetical protein
MSALGRIVAVVSVGDLNAIRPPTLTAPLLTDVTVCPQLGRACVELMADRGSRVLDRERTIVAEAAAYALGQRHCLQWERPNRRGPPKGRQIRNIRFLVRYDESSISALVGRAYLRSPGESNVFRPPAFSAGVRRVPYLT